MKDNLENLKHGFCLEQTKLVLLEAVFQNFVCIKRNKRFFEDDFFRFAIATVFQILPIAIRDSTCSN